MYCVGVAFEVEVEVVMFVFVFVPLAFSFERVCVCLCGSHCVCVCVWVCERGRALVEETGKRGGWRERETVCVVFALYIVPVSLYYSSSVPA